MPPQEPLLPQETDDAELSLKLTRMELERDRYKRDIENKERQLKEYEDEIITLRTQLGKSRGGGGIQLPAEQQKLVAEYEAIIKRLKGEKGELERGKEEELARQKKLEEEKEELAKRIEKLERENKALQEARDKLEKKEKEVIDLEQKASFYKGFLGKRLKDKDKELEATKQQLERELADAKNEVKLVKKRFEMTKNEELKKQLNELEKERNDKLEQLQQKDIKIKQLEEQLSEKQKQLSEKEKYIFVMEASAASDQRERERLNKEKEKESDKNIADATRHIDELERQNQEQLQVIKNLTEENERLRVSYLHVIV